MYYSKPPAPSPLGRITSDHNGYAMPSGDIVLQHVVGESARHNTLNTQNKT